MNQKFWSTVLLCLMVICFVLTIWIGISTGLFANALKYNENNSAEDSIQGASVLQAALSIFVIWFGFCFLEGITASAGFIASLISQKIAPNPIIKRISFVFFGYYSLLLILVIGIAAYGFVTVMG